MRSLVFSNRFIKPHTVQGSQFIFERFESEVKLSYSKINEVANVQIIHNSPYPVVDIYVDAECVHQLFQWLINFRN